MPIDANKVAEEAYSAGNLVTNDGYYEFDLEAAATAIQSAFAEELAGIEAERDALREENADLLSQISDCRGSHWVGRKELQGRNNHLDAIWRGLVETDDKRRQALGGN